MRIRKKGTDRQQGFTLIELLASLVILAVVISVGIKKFVYIESAANLKAIEAGVAELNTRETMTWTNHIFGVGGYQSDGPVWTLMSGDTNLGTAYSWNAGPGIAGGTLQFGGDVAVLTRTASSSANPARWRM